MRKKIKPDQSDQSIEIAAQKYRDAVLGNGDIDEADRLLKEIQPQCEQLMRGYGIIWDPTLDQFLRCCLLGYSRFDGESFLAFFLRNARRNFNLPKIETPDFHGTGLTVFLQTWESSPERVIGKVDNELRRKRRAEERAAAAADPAEQQEN